MVAIYTDNRAAIRSVAKAESHSRAYTLAEIAQRAQRVQDIGR